MESGRVRAVLLQHLQGRARPAATPSPRATSEPAGAQTVAGAAATTAGPGAPTATPDGEAAADPAGHVPAARLAEALAPLRPRAQRAAAHDYIALWARTFPTLVRHLRGRPEHALRLWCHEVYPYLRDERRAARVESIGRGRAKVLLASDLPPAYLGGLLEAFVALSRAEAHVEATGAEEYVVHYRLHPTDRVAQVVRILAAMRVPMLLTAALGVLVGMGLAAWLGPVDPLLALACLVGAVAAQAGANGLHEIRSPRARGPLSATPARVWLWSATGAGYLVAAAVGGYLVWTGRYWVLGLAAAGLGLSLLYAAFRDNGLGPFFAGFVHGPLIVGGTAVILSGPMAGAWSQVLLASLPVGLLTATVLFLDDLADRPIDEASGKRTLAVRLPQRRHLVAFIALLAGAGATAVWIAAVLSPLAAVVAAGIAIPAALLLVRAVQHNADDPRGLTGARLGILALHLTLSSILALTLAGVLA